MGIQTVSNLVWINVVELLFASDAGYTYVCAPLASVSQTFIGKQAISRVHHDITGTSLQQQKTLMVGEKLRASGL